jgi:peptidyl-prolyl cis-trans isomerase A (cyclophilin A)
MKPLCSAVLVLFPLALLCCKSSDSAPELTATAATAASVTPPTPPTPPVVPAVAPPSPSPAASAADLASKVHPALLTPALLKDKAPAVFKAQFTTSQGSFVVEVHRDWAPNGADRIYNLVKAGFYDDTRFFRAIDGFMVQFGISGDPAVNTKWRDADLQDDPVKQSNKRGYVTFAMAGPNTRTTQIFINYKDNGNLDGMGFSSFGQVTKGMDVVDSLYKGYGEGAPRGMGPDQGRLQQEGNAYLDTSFPKLDRVIRATIVP